MSLISSSVQYVKRPHSLMVYRNSVYSENIVRVGYLRIAVAEAWGQFGNPEKGNICHWKLLPED
jgi:hypothetical protein